jgi:predicted nucleotidyltransferase
MPKKRTTTVPYVQPYRYPSPDIPLTAIRRFARLIAERFRPDKIILFGSYAYGTPHAESDVDLLVIMPAYNEISKSVRITLAFDPPFALDLIVRTPQHVERGLREDDWFLREVIEKGKVLYEAPNGSVGAQSGRRLARSAGPRRAKTGPARSRVFSLPTSRGKIPQGPAARTGRPRTTHP